MSLTTIPAVDPNYVLQYEERLKRLDELSRRGDIINVLLTGPTGCGKTSFGEQFAARFKRPFFMLECGAISESEQLLGQWEVRPNADGNGAHTQFNLSGFLRAVQTPNAVILCNEVNRFQSIKAENAMFSLLDYQRKLYLNEIKETVTVAPGVIFMATINEGAEYTGTDRMDLAFRNRWSRYYTLSWLPEEQEVEVVIARTGLDKEQAQSLVNLANSLRDIAPVSLRQIQAAAEELVLGASVYEAIMTTYSGIVDPENLATMGAAAIPGFKSGAPAQPERGNR